jgi:hypothetical protein
MTTKYEFRNWKSPGVLLCLTLFSWLPATVSAEPHAQGQSYILFDIYESRIAAQYQATIPDLNRALGLSLPEDGTATVADIEAVLEIIKRYYNERVTFIVEGDSIGVAYGNVDLLNTGFAQFVALDFTFEGIDAVPDKITIEYNALFEVDPKHKALLAIMHSWRDGVINGEQVALIFEPDDRTQTLDVSDPSVWKGFLAIVKLGTEHIWGGIDHLLFLLALILPAVVRRRNGKWVPVDGFKPAFVYVIKIVTIFTLAHSVTLSLAALGLITLPSRLVESIIAASILAAALDILFPVFGRRIWVVVFGFGLFHGFGFAGALVQMGVTREFAGLSLFGFNVGVEVGQVVVIALAFPLLFLIRNSTVYPRWVLQGGAVALSAIALLWLVERALDFNIPLAAIAKQIAGGM